MDRISLPQPHIRSIPTVLILGLLFAAVTPAAALHQRIYPLAELLKDSDFVGTGRVVAADPVKMRAACIVDSPLKGQAPYRWLALNLAPGGWGHPPHLVRRLGPGVPLLYFAARVKQRHVLLAYTNGTWFQLTAPDGPDPDRLPWSFTHVEIWLRRTYSGSTGELEQVLREVLAGRREAPAPNPHAGPGMGPELPREGPIPKGLPELPEHVARALAAPRAAGNLRKLATRPLTPAEQQWVEESARRYDRTPEDTTLVLAQAKYVAADARMALHLEKEHGRGGNRAWVRSAEEILDLKQRSDRLTWLDIRGVLLRAGELFTPVNDPVDLIHGLRLKFTWDELDPLFDDDKWNRRRLADEIARKLEARMPHPLGAGDRVRGLLATHTFGAAFQGELTMESAGWKPLPGPGWDFARRMYDWDGAERGSQRPGTPFHAPGALQNLMASRPPPPGLPFAANGGTYPGAALWFATALGDYERRPRGGRGCYAYADDPWLRVRQGESRSFLITAQVYTPDHTAAVGETRAGWFYIRRPARYIDAGIRIVDGESRSLSLLPEQALLLKVEPTSNRFDRVLLRVDISTQKQEGRRHSEGRNEVRMIAYADGIGEVARTSLDLNLARRGDQPALDASDAGVAFTPAFGIRTPSEGYVPEFFLGQVKVQQINEGAVEVLRTRPGAGNP